MNDKFKIVFLIGAIILIIIGVLFLLEKRSSINTDTSKSRRQQLVKVKVLRKKLCQIKMLTYNKIYLAGGCFWGVEEYFQE